MQGTLKSSYKDVVKSSVLSPRWRNLWKDVPGLDLDYSDFPEYETFVSFVDSFLGFNSESHWQSLRLKYNCYRNEPYGKIAHIRRWINNVLKRKVRYIHVLEDSSWRFDEVRLPMPLYTCESLVCLKLSNVTLSFPKSISLPCLKVIDLTTVHFVEELAFQVLISGCPVLESLKIERSFRDRIEVLRVCSQSLLSFTHVGDDDDFSFADLVVAIDAPRLEYLRLSGGRTASVILNNHGSLVVVDIDISFNLCFINIFNPNELPEKNIMIRNFLVGISCVKDMIISSSTLKVIFNYSRCEQLPLFSNLSSLRVDFTDYRWEMLPVFLENCKNLKSLVVGSTRSLEKEGISILSGPRCFLSSLEYVEIGWPLKGETMEMELVSYFMEKATILKKITLCLDDSVDKEESVILKKLLTIPRISTSCQVVVL